MTEDEQYEQLKALWGIEVKPIDTRLMFQCPLLPLVALLTHGSMALGVAKGLATASANTTVQKELDRLDRQMSVEMTEVFK